MNIFKQKGGKKAATLIWLQMYYISLCFCIKWHYGLIWLNSYKIWTIWPHWHTHEKEEHIIKPTGLLQWMASVSNLLILILKWYWILQDSKLMINKRNQGDRLQLKCSLIDIGQLLCVVQLNQSGCKQ